MVMRGLRFPSRAHTLAGDLYARRGILLRTDGGIVVPTSSRIKRRSTHSRKVRTGPTSAAPRATRIGKVRKAFWLDPRLLDDARESLGASTEREAVEMALDLVGFRKDLAQGARVLRRLALSRID
jgi:hypothetical protein